MTPAPTSIYIVEDEALIAMEMSDRLTALGYIVCGQASRGEQALEEIPVRRPHLVLMDIKLAGELTGIETARRLRSRLDVPVVFVSAFSDSRLVDEAVRTGSFGYLVKPFEERELHATIQAARYKHQVEQLLREDKERLEAIVQERTAALLESEAQLRDIFDATNDLVVSTDAMGRLLFVNRAWRDTLGYSAEEVAGMKFLDAVAPAEREACGALVTRLFAGEGGDVLETCLRRKNGTNIVVEGRLSVRVVRGQIDGARGIFRDITARKAAEAQVLALNQRLEQLVEVRTAALAESERRFRALFERSPILIKLFTVPEGRIVEINDAALAVFGYTREEAVGRTTIELDLWADPADRVRFLDQLRAHGQVSRYETQLRRKNGECFPVLYTASMIELGGVAFGLASIQDITARKRAERAAASAHHRVTVLAQLGRELAEAITPRTAIISILESARQLLGWDYCWLRLWNEDTQAFDSAVNFDLVGGERREVPGNPAALVEIPNIVRRTMRDGPQLHLRNSEEAEAASAHPFGAPRCSLSLLFAPIRRGGRLLGVVSIQSYTRNAYDREALDLLVSLSDHCAGALARLQARAALVASEERFRQIADTIHDAFWSADVELQKLLYISPGYERIWGRPLASLRDNPRSFLNAIHPEDLPRVLGTLSVQKQGLPFAHEYRIIRPDGTERWIADAGYPAPDADGRVRRYVGIARDITERKRAEEAVAQSLASLNATLEATADGILTVDAGGRIDSVNHAFVTMWRIPPEVIATRDDDRAIGFVLEQLRDPRAFVARVRHLYNQPAEESFDTLEFKDGRVFERYSRPRLLDGLPAGRVWSFRDITERKRADAALRDSEARFRGVFDASPIPILLSTAPDGHLIEANTAALTTFGYAREEVIGRTTAEFGLWVRPEQRDEFFRRIAADQGIQGFESLMRTKQGAEHTMLCTGSLVRIEGRMCVIASALDITALRKAEAEQAWVQARAFQAQKFEALGTLAGGVAHDFNNILTGIINYTTLAQEDCPPGYPQLREFLGQVLKCGNRAKELVRQILLFSRSESVQREPLLIQHVVREALTLLRSTVSPAVKIESNVDPQAPHVLGNATQIHQVMMNLTVNAVHAMGEAGGCLTVGLRQRMVDTALAGELADLQPGAHVCLEVSDTGHGMEPEVAARIFEPFFTTKKVGEGTGLGLAVVHSVVRNHGGAIRVHSKRGVGTTFELFFPVHGMPAAAIAIKSTELPRGSGQRILLVDDEPAITESMQIVLRRLGYQVTSFNQPETALAHFWAAPDSFDALFTDFQMPGMNGAVLAKKILSHRPGLPVLIASGFAGSVTAEKMHEEGVSVFIQKPVEMAQIANALAKMLRESSEERGG